MTPAVFFYACRLALKRNLVYDLARIYVILPELGVELAVRATGGLPRGWNNLKEKEVTVNDG